MPQNIKNWFAKSMTIFGFIMVGVYLFAGTMLIFFHVFDYLPKNIKTAFGLFLITYGIFRLVRIFTELKKDN